MFGSLWVLAATRHRSVWLNCSSGHLGMSRQEKMSRVMMLDIYWIQQFSSSGSECTWSHVMRLKYGASKGSLVVTQLHS